MSSPSGLPTYEAVKQSVEAFDRALVESTLAEVVQRSLSETGTYRIYPDVAAFLGRTLGGWYRLGPKLADETITLFCACHTLQALAAETPPDSQVTALTAATMEQVDIGLAWRVGLIGWIDAQLPAEQVTESALRALVERIASLGINDCWHFHIGDAAMLLIDALGQKPPLDLCDVILNIAETHFTQSTRPQGGELDLFAEQAAAAIGELQPRAQHL